MKQLIIKDKKYQQLLQGYESWLEVQGYSESSVYNMPILAQGFLYYQQELGRSLKDWQGVHYKEYMAYTQQRKNQRRAGGLSANHLNKIAHSLEQLQPYPYL